MHIGQMQSMHQGIYCVYCIESPLYSATLNQRLESQQSQWRDQRIMNTQRCKTHRKGEHELQPILRLKTKGGMEKCLLITKFNPFQDCGDKSQDIGLMMESQHAEGTSREKTSDEQTNKHTGTRVMEDNLDLIPLSNIITLKLLYYRKTPFLYIAYGC